MLSINQDRRRLTPMGGASARAQILVATAIVWSVNFAILSIRSSLDYGGDWLITVPSRLLLTLIGLALCFAIHFVLSRVGGGLARQLVASLLLLPIVTEAYAWSSVLIAWLAWGISPGPFDGGALLQLGFILWLFATWTGLYLAISFGNRLREEQARVQASQLLAQTAQLEALRYQINPHFLFNTLNSVAALIADDRKADAERMIERLSRFLRRTLNFQGEDDIALIEELDLQRAYLDVEQVRYPDLGFDLQIDEETRNIPVPNLILQPIVENAVKHGVATRPGPSMIQVRSEKEPDCVKLTVTNDTGKSCEGRSGGIGLANVEGRLAARYGTAARLMTRRPSEERFEVEILIPWRAAS